MSERREWARKTLDKLAAKITDELPQRKTDTVFQEALKDIKDDAEVEKIVAQFGYKLKFTRDFAAFARPGYEAERAVARLMHTTAFAMADPLCRLVSAKEITITREIVEKDLSLKADQPLTTEQERWAKWFLRNQAPLHDPIVEHKAPTRKTLDGVSDAEYRHARAVRGRVRPEARHIFGKAGDLVADAFVSAATNVSFGPDDRRKHLQR